MAIEKTWIQRHSLGDARRANAEKENSSLWQRNELMLVGDMRETSGFPVLFGLLDPLLAGGDEIPPDMARAFQRVAAQKHHARGFQRLHRDAIAGPENQQFWPLVTFVRDFDLAVDQIDRALFMI